MTFFSFFLSFFLSFVIEIYFLYKLPTVLELAGSAGDVLFFAACFPPLEPAVSLDVGSFLLISCLSANCSGTDGPEEEEEEEERGGGVIGGGRLFVETDAIFRLGSIFPVGF